MVAMEADITLLDAARRMNGDALAKIFDLYSVALYKYALRLCDDSLVADHIVGDVFAKLLDYLSAGNGPETNLRSYLYQMTYHLIVDESRYWHGKVALEVVDFLRNEEHSIYPGLEKRIVFERVSQAIRNELTDYQRHVIILRFLEGFSLHDTAAILGKTVNIVKAAQNRAIVILRQALDYEVVETSSIAPGSANHPIP